MFILFSSWQHQHSSKVAVSPELTRRQAQKKISAVLRLRRGMTRTGQEASSRVPTARWHLGSMGTAQLRAGREEIFSVLFSASSRDAAR